MAKIVVIDTLSGDPIPFATVAILTGQNAGGGAMTDTAGVAEISGVQNHGETVRVSHISYEPQTFTFEISGGVPDALEQTVVYLTPATYEIGAAEIVAFSDEPKTAGISPGAKWAIGILAVMALAAGINKFRNG